MGEGALFTRIVPEAAPQRALTDEGKKERLRLRKLCMKRVAQRMQQYQELCFMLKAPNITDIFSLGLRVRIDLNF